MYPPKNVGLIEYFSASVDGILKANRGTMRANWAVIPCFALVWYGIYQVGKAGGKYYTIRLEFVQGVGKGTNVYSNPGVWDGLCGSLIL